MIGSKHKLASPGIRELKPARAKTDVGQMLDAPNIHHLTKQAKANAWRTTRMR
jgi:hypothetical protein